MSKNQPNSIAKLLATALQKNGYQIAETTQQQFLNYLELLQRWNQAFNLTAIRDADEMVWLHLLDSLSISSYLHGDNIIDVGTGAGLPGIPLALMHPKKRFTLLDSNSKKTRFLTQAKAELGLQNIEVIHSRCEEFQPENKFSSILSRAFSSIRVMLETTQHMLAPGGQFLAMKGVYPKEELNEIPPEFKIMGVHKLDIQGLAALRHVVCIERT